MSDLWKGDAEMNSNKIISFGAGVNSVAMVIMLYKRGEIYPCVFADTMAEHPETYCYMDYFEKEFMSKYGQKIIRLSPIDTPEYYRPQCQGKSLEDYCIERQIIPTFKNRHCTQNYKQEPKESYQQGIQKNIFGFAYDEKHRAIGDDYYPLVEAKITRQGCIEIIQREGLNVPRKSGCFFCCFQRLSNWEDLYRNYPDYYAKALYIESVALSKNPKMTLRNDVSLTILRERFESKGGELFPDYDYEELTPCMCIT